MRAKSPAERGGCMRLTCRVTFYDNIHVFLTVTLIAIAERLAINYYRSLGAWYFRRRSDDFGDFDFSERK